ncbi:MAG: hypothetical protein ACRYGP_17500 [Janthinobacterium lividum]
MTDPLPFDTAAALAELREIEANEEAARAQPGGDVGSTPMMRPAIQRGGEPDALALLRDAPLIRLGSRRLGPDFGPYRAPEFKPDNRPLPKGLDDDRLTSGHSWRRATLPAEGWHFGGTRPADGVEACAWCARSLRKGQPLAIVAHESNDVVMSCCAECGGELIGTRLVIEGADPSPWLMGNSLRSMFRDPSLWRGDEDTGAMVLYFGDDFEVRLMQTSAGIAAEIEFPDLDGEVTVVGTYRSHANALAATWHVVQEWEAD